VRTLTRASLGRHRPHRQALVDDRVALEAKRLLAESDLPVAEVGARLGFTEATNFGRFFARTVGSSPGAFRAASRQGRGRGGHHHPTGAAPGGRPGQGRRPLPLGTVTANRVVIRPAG
jgi:hypothetical protein